MTGSGGEQTRQRETPLSSLQTGFLALSLFAFLFSVYLFTFSGTYHSSDEMSMLVATDSLARRGAWDIDLLRWMGEQQGSFGPDGHLYSRKGIGATLAALPLYWLALQSSSVGNVQAAMLTGGLLTALTGVLVYLTLRRLRYGDGASLLTALAFGLATMAWPYARLLFSETLAGLGLMLGVYALVRFGALPLQTPLRASEEPASSPQSTEAPAVEGGALFALLAGAGLGVALLARLNNAIAAPFLGLLLLVYCHRRFGRRWRSWVGPLVLFGVPVVAALAVTAWYNELRFGAPLTTGYLPEERFSAPFFLGLYGLTLSPGKGLLWYSPILFAAAAAWPGFCRRRRVEALVAAGLVLSQIAFYAPWYLWWAGHGWGPRFLVASLPFGVLPLAHAFETASRRRAWAVGLAALILASVAVQVLGVAVNSNLYLEDVYARLGLYHPATLFDPAYSPLVRQWGYLRAENLDLAWARGGAVNLGALLLGVAMVTACALALRAAWRKRLGAWMGGALLCLLAAGSAALLIFFAPSGDVRAAATALALMERPGEAAVLTDSRLTEALQDAYDGGLPLWGAPDAESAAEPGKAVWTIGGGSEGQAAARFQLGSVRLEALLPPGLRFDRARLMLPEDIRWLHLGNVAEAAVDVQAGRRGAALRAGESLGLTACWVALAPTAISYTVFVQAVDAQGGKAGQIDRLPCGGSCPTTAWRPGDLLCESYTLRTDRSAAPGLYDVIVGLYDLETGQRLPVIDEQGREVGTAISAGTIQIEP